MTEADEQNLSVWDRIKNEPVLLVGLVQSILALAITFGLSLDTEQVGAIMALTTAGLAFAVREVVTGPITASRLNVTGDAVDARVDELEAPARAAAKADRQMADDATAANVAQATDEQAHTQAEGTS